ncbi:hypothetical protein LWE82_01180 [Clostridioides difficile]|uniref:hypothetical protein n=1 Tax=Clostridioides difficile TaxID=1496 RepID=UPI001E47FE5D|nr:hypothetical protein [Clostridioides difficile]MCE0710875.1 hypothetical protein [Clostridioides difficile]
MSNKKKKDLDTSYMPYLDPANYADYITNEEIPQGELRNDPQISNGYTKVPNNQNINNLYPNNINNYPKSSNSPNNLPNTNNTSGNMNYNTSATNNMPNNMNSNMGYNMNNTMGIPNFSCNQNMPPNVLMMIPGVICHNTMQGMPVVMPSTMPPNIYPTPYGSSNMSMQGIPQATNIEEFDEEEM